MLSKNKIKRPYSLRSMLVYLLLGAMAQTTVLAQDFPSDKVVSIEKLSHYLKDDVKSQLVKQGEITPEKLALYLRAKFSERFFYDWQTVDDRFVLYNGIYKNQNSHKNRALDHMGKYQDSTQWALPFNYLNGEAVNAYALRHLARQHKMVDIAFLYFNDGKDPKYISYFEKQMRSLNHALSIGAYEKIKDGNGVYEVFRSGYRILNWLRIHTMFLGEQEYSDQDQLYTIATLLQHGEHLYERNAKFNSGNHQTRGMSALAMLSILLKDFKGTDKWFERAMTRLEEHLLREINDDGFQFERSVHYHMSDINNYFYVYQLAKISGIEVGPVWEEKLQSLFTTLVKIAYPDKTAPVLQDDTEIPWGEKNEIAGVMTLGYLLFEDAELGYFADNHVDDSMYWFLQKKQLDLLENIATKKPEYGSLVFPKTHYYIMRQGWNKNDKVMTISAGLDPDKPDHQHGDMLGIQAVANGQVILPNYQVRYSLKDFELFKNSMVKNVALVDNELQGKQWTSNKGGSGFGKFAELPNPKTITWKSTTDFDLFVGSHDGFENVGVSYSRHVIFVKDDLWIVKDNFESDSLHTYKQVWQGHYTAEEGPNLIRSTFNDASGSDILQLNPADKVESSGARGKQWSVVSKENQKNFSFVTVIYPYRGYSNRIDETNENLSVGDWSVNSKNWELEGKNPITLSKANAAYCFNISKITKDELQIEFNEIGDVYINIKSNGLTISNIGDKAISILSASFEIEKEKRILKPGGQVVLQFIRS
nr:heparinase II/III family protein [uncultured Allomuricauda sp.]